MVPIKEICGAAQEHLQEGMTMFKKISVVMWLVIILGCFSAAVPADSVTEDTGAGSTDKVEGNGFDAPEDALAAYINGLIDCNFDEMMAAFAVETYAANYNVAKAIEWSKAFVPTIMNYVPPVSDFSVRLNIETRRAEISRTMTAHYLILADSEGLCGEDNNGMPIPLDAYDSTDALFEELYPVDETALLSSLSFKDEFYDPALLNESYSSDLTRNNMLKRADFISGEDMASVAAKLYAGEESFLLMADAVKLNGKWYLYSMGGTLGSIAALPANNQGMFPMKYSDTTDFRLSIPE